ncbi:uncharacterized protein LOC117110667 isoform X2 [Anneissia japonica]|uniref:uncharacterized protein LOC117110667 isoform X2 n=1 Tax=Anneissia japonica TaxID=1529436 RepID=UPI001425A0AA|nr:uncharacterized protein LOC117110667 isoform X2 [Anneissia japonica]
MSAEKSLLTLDYVHLKGKQYSREHGKRFHNRTLGDVDKRHQIVPPKSSHKLFSTMMSLEFEEARAVNDMTAQHIIRNQRTQIKNTFHNKLRSCQLDEWRSTPFSQNKVKKKSLKCNERPATASQLNTMNIVMAPSVSVRPFSTGPRIRTVAKKPAKKNMYVRVENKNTGGFRDIDIRKVAKELRNSWVDEDKPHDVKTPRKRVKSLELPRYDMFSGQWLSFAGGGSEEGGVLDAFLGKDVDEYYNIEGQVGSVVVNQVTNGNKVQVCINGKLQSDDMKVKKWKSEESQDKFPTRQSDSPIPNITPGLVKSLEDRLPLSWEDQITRSSVKILEPTVLQPAKVKKDTSERHPVVFQKLVSDDRPRAGLIKPNSYRVRSRTKNKRTFNGMESLNNHITVVTVDQHDDDADSLTSEDYHEILRQRITAGQKPHEDKKEESKEHKYETKCELKKSSQNVLRSTSSTSYYSLSKENLASLAAPGVPMTPSGFAAASSYVNLIAQGSNPNLQSRPASSVGSNRVQRSSSSKCSYSHEERQSQSATTQHQQLAKQGHLLRSGVSSISNGMQDREKEFVSISQQIRLPSGVPLKKQESSPDFHLKLSLPEKHPDYSDDELDESIGKLSHGNSMESLDSMMANGNDDILDHEHHSCTCTLEAKMAVSAALSGAPHQLMPSTIINVSLPSVQMSTSDSLSDLEPGAQFHHGSSKFSHGCIIEESTEELIEANNAIKSTETKESFALSNTKAEVELDVNKNEVDMIINKVDGLSITPDSFQTKQETQTLAKRPRSVKFQDEVVVNTPSVPTNSPRAIDLDGVSDFSFQ